MTAYLVNKLGKIKRLNVEQGVQSVHIPDGSKVTMEQIVSGKVFFPMIVFELVREKDGKRLYIEEDTDVDIRKDAILNFKLGWFRK